MSDTRQLCRHAVHCLASSFARGIATENKVKGAPEAQKTPIGDLRNIPDDERNVVGGVGWLFW
jgi:hypothetical protein